MTDISGHPFEFNQSSRGTQLAAEAFSEFGPRTATADAVYRRALKKFKITANDKPDFDAELLRRATARRGVIDLKGRK